MCYVPLQSVMSTFPLKPTHKPVKAYFEALRTLEKYGHTTEGNTRSAFADLLKKCCSAYDWHLVEEYPFKGTGKQPLRADGALVDDLTLVHGLWEAKDADDDLGKEIKSKVAKGYPLTNILFQSPTHAVLYQGNRIAFDRPITTPEALVEVLQLFFEHKQAHEVDWETAVTKFAEQIPNLAQGVTKILEDEHTRNSSFRERFAAFAELCRQSINPDLSDESVRKMLVQHLLTARIFTRVFNNEEFLRRNVIAAEIEKVIDSITSRYFSRSEFLKPLDRFYTAIERAAESQTGYTEKQHFLNAVYEKFFQRFDTKQADTHGIVYTPQPIVDFMVRSVDEILQQEFGKSLSDSGVHILDPFTGTGNFITRIMQQIKRSALPQKYAEELHCNEIMLLPYYIASMNIEHAYMERANAYKSFEGICLVDTFELSEFGQQSFAFSNSNTERVIRQKRQPIFVVIGNPPYNMGQESENDQNKNRKYRHWDNRIKDTYTKDSTATLKNKLSDPYVKAFRWASDRIRTGGVIAYVTNNSYVDQIAFDGMRHHLARDFSFVYILDLGGNVRQNPKLSGTTHNVFGIQVGVCITLLVKHTTHKHPGKVFYARMPELWRRRQKYMQLTDWQSLKSIFWTRVDVDRSAGWTSTSDDDFADLLPLHEKGNDERSLFGEVSLGISTNRDEWTINFRRHSLLNIAGQAAGNFNLERNRRQVERDPKAFVLNGERNFFKWSRALLKRLRTGNDVVVDEAHVRIELYRPFTRSYIYLNRDFVDFPSKQIKAFPARHQSENRQICTSGIGHLRFQSLASKLPIALDLLEKTQSFPFFLYREDGTKRRENITDWALAEFRTHYTDATITKWDIFHATYAVLHHPEYRTRYAANLKRELPRIPFPPDLHTFAGAGKRLMELHIDYEQQPEHPLQHIEHPTNPVSFRVERIKLSKDKNSLTYNTFLTLRGIPPATFDYRLGNRSALEWVIDQYRVSTDPRSGITNDPNREDDPKYILRLIGQVITVSVETMQLIASLPRLGLDEL